MDAVHKTPQPSRYRISKATAKPDRPQPWTASRCHRLLRPLLSRLALLRKELTSFPAAEPAAVDLPTTTTAKDRRKSGGKRHSSDCQWMLPRKKMRHTYAQQQQQQRSAERQTSIAGSSSENLQPVSIKLRAAKDLQGADDNLPAPGETVAFTPLGAPRERPRCALSGQRVKIREFSGVDGFIISDPEEEGGCK
ncbi:hypothetical protein PG987_014343 [Apiospora arundinis]